MLRVRRVALLLWLAVGWVVPWGSGEGVAYGGGKAARLSAAQELVREALHREIYGLQDERDSLLREALQLEPELVAARWHQGLVRYRNQWLPAEEVPQWAARDRALTAYERQRQQQPDTAAGHGILADWCRKEGLQEQERAHLCRILDLLPDDAQARARLGYRRLEGNWVTEAEIQTADALREATRRALAKWRPKLEDLRDQLARRGEKQREAAAAAIRA